LSFDEITKYNVLSTHSTHYAKTEALNIKWFVKNIQICSS